MSLIYEANLDPGYNIASNLFTKDNDNLFMLTSRAIIHFQLATGEAKVLDVYDQGQIYSVSRLRSGSYDKISDRIFFTGRDGELFELKSETSSATNLAMIESFNLFPNPARDRLFLDFPSYDNRLIELYGLNGSLLLQIESAELQASLDVSFLPKGLYLVRVLSKQGVISKKFVVN